jgi:hypothetical protein
MVLLHTGSTVATFVKDHFNYRTIRCSSCEILLQPPQSRCDTCRAYRKVLNSMVSRQQESSEHSPSQPSSHANFRYLNTPQRKKRIRRLQVTVKVSQLRVKRLKERLEKAIEV